MCYVCVCVCLCLCVFVCECIYDGENDRDDHPQQFWGTDSRNNIVPFHEGGITINAAKEIKFIVALILGKCACVMHFWTAHIHYL